MNQPDTNHGLLVSRKQRFSTFRCYICFQAYIAVLGSHNFHCLRIDLRCRLMRGHQHADRIGSTNCRGTIRPHAPGATTLEDQLVTSDGILIVIATGVGIQCLGAKPHCRLPPFVWKLTNKSPPRWMMIPKTTLLRVIPTVPSMQSNSLRCLW